MCDGTPCPCNLEPKPAKTPDQQRKGALAALVIFGPILAAGIVAIVADVGTGVLVLLASWLVGLCVAVADTLRQGR